MRCEEIKTFRHRVQQRVLLVGYEPDLTPIATHIVDKALHKIDPAHRDFLEKRGIILIERDWYMLGHHDIGTFDVILGNLSLNRCGHPESGAGTRKVIPPPIVTSGSLVPEVAVESKHEDFWKLFEILRSKLTHEHEAKMVFQTMVKPRPSDPIGKIVLSKGEDFKEFYTRVVVALAHPFVTTGDLYDIITANWEAPEDLQAMFPNVEDRSKCLCVPHFHQLPHPNRIMEVDIPNTPYGVLTPILTWTF